VIQYYMGGGLNTTGRTFNIPWKGDLIYHGMKEIVHNSCI
jgi:hypothetical protein